MTKIGFICTVHKSKKHRPTGDALFQSMMASLVKSCTYDFTVYVFDNASDPVFEIDNKFADKIVLERIENQYEGGVTYTWNEGIKKALTDRCDVVIIIEDDEIFDNTINDFIETILTHELNDNAIFGPVSNKPNTTQQLSNKPTGKITVLPNTGDIAKNQVNGFCLGMTRKTIENNYFDDKGNLFSTHSTKKWGGQDVELQKRIKYSIVVGKCYVYHSKVGGWREIREQYG